MLQPFVLGAGFLAALQEGSMRRYLSILVIAIVAVVLAGPAAAQEKPRYGGELVFAVPSEPPSYDAHREETFGVMHPMAPHYNTLLRVDPLDKTGTKPVGDLAESSSKPCRHPTHIRSCSGSSGRRPPSWPPWRRHGTGSTRRTSWPRTCGGTRRT